MTEQEWLTSTDPVAMLEEVQFDERRTPPYRGLSDRKLRLFTVGLCRQVWDGTECGRCLGTKYTNFYLDPCDACRATGRIGGLTDPRSRHAVETAERFADGMSSAPELIAAAAAAHEVHREEFKARDFEIELAWRCASPDLQNDLLANSGLPRWFSVSTKLAPQQATLLRCVVGNPFRPATLCGMQRKPYHNQYAHVDTNGGFWLEADCPACAELRTPTVLAIARDIYDRRAWDEVGVLADALEEAGIGTVPCEMCKGKKRINTGPGDYGDEWGDCPGCFALGYWPHPFVVHLRCDFHHCRGCHVVDALLGKE